MRNIRLPRVWGSLCAVASLLGATGCGMVPQRRLEDSRLRIQALQAENEQLHDVVLNVRSKNRDLAARAEDDARRVRTLEEANQQLERSVLAYQDETRQMAALLDRLRGDVRMAASAGSTTVSLHDRLRETFAGETDVRVDPDALSVSLPHDALFDRQTGELTPDAARWLSGLGAAIRADARDRAADAPFTVEIAGAPLSGGERLAGAGETDDEAQARWRSQRLRAEVERASGLAPQQFRFVAESRDAEAAAEGGWVTLRIAAQQEDFSAIRQR